MPDIEIVKLKIRRGTDSQRQSVVLEQGELGYTIDTKRVWVGDGVLSGGNIVGNIAHPPLDVVNKTGLTNAVKGDIVNERGLLYQLSGTDFAETSAWGFIGTRVDNNVIEYDASNQITVKSLSGSFAPNSGLADDGSGTKINVDNETLYITNTNTLSVLSVDQKHISSSSFDNGISGGSGTKITLDVDSTQFGFNSKTLTLTAIENGIVNVASLSADSIGNGLQINISGDKLEAKLQSTDGSTVTDIGGVVQLHTIGGGGVGTFSDITFDQYGRVTGQTSTIIDSLSVNIADTGHADALSGENWYRGYYDTPLGGVQSLIYAISAGDSSNEILTLSSAGFIQLNNGSDTPGSRLAIPAYLF
jgi:hypothetical protein